MSAFSSSLGRSSSSISNVNGSFATGCRATWLVASHNKGKELMHICTVHSSAFDCLPIQHRSSPGSIRWQVYVSNSFPALTSSVSHHSGSCMSKHPLSRHKPCDLASTCTKVLTPIQLSAQSTTLPAVYWSWEYHKQFGWEPYKHRLFTFQDFSLL